MAEIPARFRPNALPALKPQDSTWPASAPVQPEPVRLPRNRIGPLGTGRFEPPAGSSVTIRSPAAGQQSYVRRRLGDCLAARLRQQAERMRRRRHPAPPAIADKPGQPAGPADAGCRRRSDERHWRGGSPIAGAVRRHARRQRSAMPINRAMTRPISAATKTADSPTASTIADDRQSSALPHSLARPVGRVISVLRRLLKPRARSFVGSGNRRRAPALLQRRPLALTGVTSTRSTRRPSISTTSNL